MKKKLLLSLTSILLASALLVACNNDTNTDDTGNGDPDTSDNGTDDNEEGVTLVYWSMWESTEPQGQVIQEAADAWSEETGNTMDVQFQGRAGIQQGLQPALDAQQQIDLFDEDLDRVNNTWGSYLLDLEDLVASSGYEDTANAGLIEAARQLQDGTLKTIPYQPYTWAYFYNVDLFEEAGVEGVPTTWDEFMNVNQQLVDAGITPITTDDAYITFTFAHHINRLLGEPRAREVVDDGLWAEEPGVLTVAQDFEEMASLGFFSENISSNVWPNGQNVEFALGDVAMYLNGSWFPNEVKDIVSEDFTWGAFAYPEVNDGETGTDYGHYGSQVYAIVNTSEYPEEAFSFIEMMTKGEYDQKLSDETIGIPADSTNAEWPEMLAPVQDVMNSMGNRYTSAADSNADITPILKENLQRLFGGEITAQEFVDAMEAAS